MNAQLKRKILMDKSSVEKDYLARSFKECGSITEKIAGNQSH